MLRLTKEEKKEMMENFVNEAEEEINELIDLNDEEKEEEYKYKKDEKTWYIRKNVLKSANEKNMIEIRVKRNNYGEKVNEMKKGERICESSWIYKENENCRNGKDNAIGKKDSKIKNGLSYQNYRIEIF